MSTKESYVDQFGECQSEGCDYGCRDDLSDRCYVCFDEAAREAAMDYDLAKGEGRTVVARTSKGDFESHAEAAEELFSEGDEA